MPPPRPPPPLVDDLVEEVLLRFPPKDPAALVRAALVCKRWRRLVSGPGFRRRFSEFHRTPPMLGMFCNGELIRVSDFVPTTTFRPHHAERRHRRALDARHGRVLFHGEGRGLSVWDPITDEEWKLPFPPEYAGPSMSWTAMVLCSAAAGAGGCDHLDCHSRPFIVVFVASSVSKDPDAVVTFIYTYSSNAAAWSEPTYSQQPACFVNPWIRSALVGNTLYFGHMLKSSTALKYNMQLRQMSWIQVPSIWPFGRLSALTTTEDGGLRFAVEQDCKLYIWSTKDADEVDTRWEQNGIIELNTLLPLDADLTKLDTVGFMDDLCTIFVSVDDAAYAIDLKTYKAKKVYKGAVDTIVPYVSFYTPALEADGTAEGPSAGGSSA
ncbi:hypothetical protein SORBI_3002G014700 [Sorghum bicolor]|uniref:F-box domain-containing protein n=2 Tax=Sorghum bicolor TaxID=4558 RepID=C5X7Z3_SORBI|nr:hypothetical protein SORBI_3002G014700 [Sorghum bicolor]